MEKVNKLLKKGVAPYEQPDTKKSIAQIFITIPPYLLLWYLAYLSLSISYGLTMLIGIVAAGFLVRIFILFHDFCHQTLFQVRKANEIFGTITGILTMFPYEKWKKNHSIHHATSSNLTKRGTGDIWMLTVDEYAAASFWKRLGYRLYRNPLVMFGLGPFFVFIIRNRFNSKKAKFKERMNTYITNCALVLGIGLLCIGIGWQQFLMVHLPIFYVSGAIGTWLFYVQHQFEETYFEEEADWSYVRAAVDGSSYYKLPSILRWLTGNIGFHHVHHLSPRVPYYNLKKAHDQVPALHNVSTITLSSSLQALRFRLWDETNKTFVRFKDVKHLL